MSLDFGGLLRNVMGQVGPASNVARAFGARLPLDSQVSYLTSALSRVSAYRAGASRASAYASQVAAKTPGLAADAASLSQAAADILRRAPGVSSAVQAALSKANAVQAAASRGILSTATALASFGVPYAEADSAFKSFASDYAQVLRSYQALASQVAALSRRPQAGRSYSGPSGSSYSEGPLYPSAGPSEEPSVSESLAPKAAAPSYMSYAVPATIGLGVVAVAAILFSGRRR